MTLTERLRSGTGADRSLDEAIAEHFGWKCEFNLNGEEDPRWFDPQGKPVGAVCPRFIDDLNAVSALVEREGFHWMKYWGNRVKLGRPNKVNECQTVYNPVYESDDGNDLCRALLLALLVAKEGK